MARGILSEYGNDTPKQQAPRITKNGPASDRDVNNYRPPQGPIGIGHSGPGLGGVNLGNAGTQGKSSCETDDSGGSPGLHGSNKGMGVNRAG
jgi:hypothetical protein